MIRVCVQDLLDPEGLKLLNNAPDCIGGQMTRDAGWERLGLVYSRCVWRSLQIRS